MNLHKEPELQRNGRRADENARGEQGGCLSSLFLHNLGQMSELLFGAGVDRFGFADRTLGPAGDGGTAMATEKSTGSKRGFAAMSPEKQREIAAKGGRASHGGGRRPGSSSKRRSASR